MPAAIGQRGNGIKLKEGIYKLDTRKNFFCNEGSEILAQVAQERDDTHSTPGNIQSHIWQGSEQPDLTEDAMLIAQKWD